MKKFSLPTSMLAAAIDFVSGAIEVRHTLPILTNVLLTFRNHYFCVIGSNLELEMEYRIDPAQVTSDEPFENGWGMTLPAKKLRDLLKSAPSGSTSTIQVGNDDATQHILSFSGLRSRYTLQGLSAKDYPDTPVEKERTMLSVDLTEFMQTLQSVSFSMANQDVRYYLNGVQMQASGNQIILTATDGHRLAQNRMPVTMAADARVDAIIPRASVLEFPALLKGASGELTIAVTPNHLMAKATVGDTIRVVKTKLIDGRFPDWSRVIPKNALMDATFNRFDALSSVRRVAILANEKYRGMLASFTAESITFSANNTEHEEAREETECKCSGSLDIGINSAYFMETLNSFGSEIVHVSMTNENAAMLLKPDPNSPQLCVLMPMRI